MSKEKIDILKDEVLIPDVVTNAAEDALEKILREASMEKEQKMEVALVRKERKWKKKWVAIALVAVLAVGTLTAAAGTHFNWFAAVEEDLFMSESQKAAMEKYGLGITVDDAVTQNGVTVSVEQVICDSSYFFVILGVEGMDYPTGEQWIGFEETNIDIVGGSIHTGACGKFLGVDEETGKMLYLWEGDMRDVSIVGKTMKIGIKNVQLNRPITEEESELAMETGASIDTVIKKVEGEWNFEFVLNGGSQKLEYDLVAETGNPDITLECVTITPLSIEISSIHADKEQMIADWNDPENGGEYNYGYYGFLMKDGTIINAAHGSGGGSFNKSMTGRVQLHGFGTVVDLYEIEAILFDDITDDVSVWGIENPTVDDFVVVHLPQ